VYYIRIDIDSIHVYNHVPPNEWDYNIYNRAIQLHLARSRKQEWRWAIGACPSRKTTYFTVKLQICTVDMKQDKL